MMKLDKKTLNSILKNKALHYVLSRYATYFIQFINSLFIAVYLGPYYLGVWGFISLVIQYFNQINFGITHSVNAIISIHKNKEWYVQKIIGTSLSMLLGLSCLALLFFLSIRLFDINIGEKYNFSKYLPAVVAIGILGYINSLFSSIFRVFGKVVEIAINQSAFPILMLFAILIFKGENLLWALVGANLIAFALSFTLFLLKTPVQIKPLLIGRLIKKIQKKGWHLFIYNTSFYLIVISTRTFVSMYYEVEEFGFFTFAFSLSNSLLLAIEAISYLIYPKILNRFANSNSQNNNELLTKLRDTYITTSHLLVYLALVLFPLLLVFLPTYESSYGVFTLIALTVVLYSNSFGYSGLLIAKGHEKELGRLALLSLVVNVCIVFSLTHFLKVPYSFVILGTMLTYFMYVYFLTQKGRKYLDLNICFRATIKDSFPAKLIFPYLVATFLAILDESNILMIIPLVLFMLLNFKLFISLKDNILNFLKNPKITDI